MMRIINRYIIREIISFFLLGLSVFTLILLMGRLIKLTDLVVSRGVPLLDVSRMILYLMPSFLVFTIPMAFLLAVLLSFGRLSADNEITVMKSGGISLVQLMPPVLLCALGAAFCTLGASSVGVPWGNSAFKQLSMQIMKQNAAATIREKVFWDDIPGIVLYTEHYDERSRTLNGVLINDGRDQTRPMTIFAASGRFSPADNQKEVRLVLEKGSIHAAGAGGEYRLANFSEYVMTIPAGDTNSVVRNEQDMGIGELRRQMADRATPRPTALKAAAEFHNRCALPFAPFVFSLLAVPLGIQNNRSGKSAGFSLSIGILLAYYILLSLLRTLAEKGAFPPGPALWAPNIIFMLLGLLLLRLASQEQSVWALLRHGFLRIISRGGER
jgi:lipopolysaccharide export system permease protein